MDKTMFKGTVNVRVAWIIVGFTMVPFELLSGLEGLSYSRFSI